MQEREEHNRSEQRRFILDAAEDQLNITLWVSTLDGSPVGSPEGRAWGSLKIPASSIKFSPAGRRLLIGDMKLALKYVFAMSCAEAAGRVRRIIVLDFPCQQSAAADMYNTEDVRKMVGIVGAAKFEVHPNHRPLLPALRRAAWKVIKGGRHE